LYESNRGSIAQRMRALEIQNMAISKAAADPEAAMNAANPETPAGAGLSNTQPVQNQAFGDMMGAPVVPAQAEGGNYVDSLLDSVGALGQQLGQRHGLMAMFRKNGMPEEAVMQFDMSMKMIEEQLTAAGSALAQAKQLNATLMQYDAPVQSPKMDVGEGVAMPPLDGQAGGFRI